MYTRRDTPRGGGGRGRVLEGEEVAGAAEHLGEHALAHGLRRGFGAAAVEEHVFPAGVAVEVGCGCGVPSMLLARRGWHVTMTDLPWLLPLAG